MFNVERFFLAHSSSSDVEGVLSALSNLDDSISDQTYLNPVRNSSEVRSNKYCKSPKFSDTKNVCCNHSKMSLVVRNRSSGFPTRIYFG